MPGSLCKGMDGAMLERWTNFCEAFTPGQLLSLLRQIAPAFRPGRGFLASHLKDDEPFDKAEQIGIIEFPDAQTVMVSVMRIKGELTARSSKGKQYEIAKRILKYGNHNAGIFVFYDGAGRFRFSLITVTYHGTRRQFSTFRRYTFFVDPELSNKTFLQQMRRADFSTLSGILETFSLEAVSDEFYKEFKPKFDAIAAAVQGTADAGFKQDFALLFAIRIIFLGFVQKKGWLGGDPKFLQGFRAEYSEKKCLGKEGKDGEAADASDIFYREWLEPLFFEALSSPPGRKVAYGHAPFSEKTQEMLQMVPYLNGELFKCKRGVDDEGLWIPDEVIGSFFDFLFQYNFTVEENELYDEELELNPEFLGIIFERITNMDQGAVYTPRVEVDLMCRLALVKWLERTAAIGKEDLYRLLFREAGTGEAYDEYQKQGDFSPAEIRILIERLESVTVCDPAAGSGAFEVGMLQVLEQVLENLYTRNNTPEDLKARTPAPFALKKAIIAHSLYGAEVKRWAVWINQLRLWLTLFVDMPDDLKGSFKPLLPNLTFKVRTGDSLVQRIGGKTFPVQGHANLPPEVRRKINLLKQRKHDFFYNKNDDFQLIEHEELAVFRAILDAEIAARQEQIYRLTGPRLKQVTLAETGPEQAELDFSKEVGALRSEIAGLKAQKNSLQSERPFVWSIEFAEVFFDGGGFDIIIGNPPYVRQENITDPGGALAPGDYKEALLEMVRVDFTDYFALARARLDRFKPGRKPSGRSDLYTYFYIRSLRLLNPRGVHVFICSNSWLDVGYGAWLQEFFLWQVPLYLVIDNHARRSFARADINTVITVASAPGKVEEGHIARFVAFKQPFEDAVLSENLLAIEGAKATLRDDRFRIFPITVGELWREGSEANRDLSRAGESAVAGKSIDRFGRYVGDKWGGKYLRAPDIFFTILEKGRDKLVRLGEIAEVRRGFTTGANDFFYLEPLGSGARPGLLRVRNGSGWEGEIEEEFLKPAIKSPRECRNILIKPEDLKNLLFMCHQSKAELKGTKALEYIEWGEQQKIVVSQGKNKGKRVKGFQNLETINKRKMWWSLGKRNISGLHFNYMIDDVGKTFIGDFYASDNFHDIFLDKEYAVSLNSIVFFLLQNVIGRANFGGGLMKIQAYELKTLKLLNLKTNFPDGAFCSGFFPIFQECGIDPESGIPIAEQEPDPLPARKALDDIVFDALDLTGEERKEVYRATCGLVWKRISKARSVRRNG